MLNVSNNPFTLSVIMLSVVKMNVTMLSVMAPILCHSHMLLSLQVHTNI
jgi:hypothetical protein